MPATSVEGNHSTPLEPAVPASGAYAPGDMGDQLSGIDVEQQKQIERSIWIASRQGQHLQKKQLQRGPDSFDARKKPRLKEKQASNGQRQISSMFSKS